MNRITYLVALIVLTIIFSCQPSGNQQNQKEKLTIFFVNDVHGRLNDFAKVKHIVDQAKKETSVLLVSAGDMFSGNPIVDQYDPKGYPIIDIMNQVGFDISVLGNHEFDYGIKVLQDRMQQADFEWVCANINTTGTVLDQPDPFKTLSINDVKVTIVGLLETDGKPHDIIPNTHPWRVADLDFDRFTDITNGYQKLKESENSDVLIALTHLGQKSDRILANKFPFFDVIIGGHTNHLSTETTNGIPTLMAGNKLSHLGRIDLEIEGHEVVGFDAQLTDLSAYEDIDEELMKAIDIYNDTPKFEEVIGEALTHHNVSELGCFYTKAIMEYMEVDMSFQNNGGIRAELDQGPISKLEIYNIDPFNNGTVVFTWTGKEVRQFFMETEMELHVSGMTLERNNGDLILRDREGLIIKDSQEVTIGINDYIPSVYDAYFSYEEADVKELTTAETMIQYLKTMNSTVDHEGCDHKFKY